MMRLAQQRRPVLPAGWSLKSLSLLSWLGPGWPLPDRQPPLAPASAPPPPPPLLVAAGAVPSDGIALADWADLMSAVRDRLRRLAQAPAPLRVPGLPAAEPTVPLRAAVLDCVGALDQLQDTLSHELARLQQLQGAVQDAELRLADARHLALHDGLTRLPNRRCFHEQLGLALGRQRAAEGSRSGSARALAVMYLDLDGFKAVNDAHGHAVGDALLRIVAARLVHVLRAQDLVCRLGGDEFACLLQEGLNRAQLAQVAQKLFAAVCAPLQIGMLQLVVRPSIGIAVCTGAPGGPADATTADALLQRADAAMYHAKRERCGHAFSALLPADG